MARSLYWATASSPLATLCCVVSAMVAQKKMTLRQRLFMRLSCALLGHDLQSSEGEVITALSSLLEIPQVRSNIAPFACVTVSFGTRKIVCPSLLQCSPFGRQFFFPPPAASVTFSPTDRCLGHSDAIAPVAPERAMLGTADHATTTVVLRGRCAS